MAGKNNFVVGPSLIKLNIFESDILPPSTFGVLSAALTNLEELTLSNSDTLDDNDVKVEKFSRHFYLL